MVKVVSVANLILMLILTSCSSYHAPVYSIALELENFDYDKVHRLAAEFSEDNQFKLHRTWDDSERVRSRKSLIQRIYKRHDGLAYGIRNFVKESCLSLSFYDWYEKGIDYEPTKDALVSYLEQHLPVSKLYPGQTRCIDSPENNESAQG